MSDTPRTDALAEKFKHRMLAEPEVGHLYRLCAKLERENYELRADAMHVRVPIEPTQAMCDDAYAEYQDWRMHSDGSADNRMGYRRIYKAMINAALKPSPAK